MTTIEADGDLKIVDMTEDDVFAIKEEEHTKEEAWLVVMQCLTPKQREVIVRRYEVFGSRGDSTLTIAKALGISHQAVTHRCINALDRMRKAAATGEWPAWVYETLQDSLLDW
jgi:DNA-directed RNA polymerase sigma subunit (sigma70/sigma32)